ncbi:hypothetical protein A3C86_01570 [Candidatus Kaiserbacteria bacterium RIFCSPHIGHO2_02_FULL_49_16]|uniref:Methyltransferase n=1 Tax=Candidatus Kaiserbacteria bacterium RIFCSPHIGHO2_02_FULL_49_16 TaxID=1798490 RepID=A0A1F6DE59_9BACT|nr:MAG: hypothetical protein A3C86_01570 [Candidatus Kaiserbacteria bacterium RIFCSPHIGHO2_02_FULL_49_16]
MNKAEKEPAYFARNDCRLCGSHSLTRIISFGETPLANSYRLLSDKNPEVFAPLIVNFCNDCKLVQLRDVVPPDILFKHYLYVSGTSLAFVEHFANYAKNVTGRFSLSSKSLVIDIGSNDGVLLSQFKKLGVRILGIDPAKNIAEDATKRGIQTIADFLTAETAQKIASEHGKARVITANNVFAHTDDVAGFVESMKILLAENGVFIFEVQYLKDLIEKNLFDIIYHEHLCYYHLSPLVSFFKLLGLSVFDVERVGTHGGSIRVFVGWNNGGHEQHPRVDKLLIEEEILNTLAPYKTFAKRIAENRVKVLALLNGIKKSGKRIAGYGAPAKATTFCYALGIGRSTLDYIVDDAPMKQGRVMPGTHIPIKSPSFLYEDKPDYCLILAWNFADSIMQNHARFKKQGGKFIVPMPEPRIL